MTPDVPALRPFATVLVANRGEIAVRIVRTLRRLGYRSAAIYSDADTGASHVLAADIAVRVGPPPARLSYLDIGAVVAAARRVGAQAVHPGYGFLAENAAFARACSDAGLVFVGPPAAAIEAMGDKISAKRTVEAAGVPVVPGVHRPGLTDADLAEAASQIGFPVLLKPSAGGGGKGMHRVDDATALPAAVASARRESASAFGNDELLVERWIDRPRHIEIQVLADSHGGVVHLGERECSLQRRHQKIIEEAPSPLLSPAQRARMGAAAVDAARACGYVGAGTVEFILSGDRPDEFFFMEMNTRLQVEHPVTEMVTGLDLVEEQLRCAAGEPLRLGQDDVRLTGHAVEARIYAEDPAREFLPAGGTVLALREAAGEGVRVDSGIVEGSVVGTDYDPMIAKVVAWGNDRASALRRLDGALAGTGVLGVHTNTAFLRALLAQPDVAAGRLDTGLVERRMAELVRTDVPLEAVVAAALGRLAQRAAAAGDDPFDALTGWRVGGRSWTHERLRTATGSVVDVAVQGPAHAARVRTRYGDVVGDPVSASATLRGRDLDLVVDGRAARWLYATEGPPESPSVWVGRDGGGWALREVEPQVRERAASASIGPLRAPMPGTVSAVHVAVGDQVAAGEPLVVVEAMKMEHVVRSASAGTVTELYVAVADTVALDAPLAVVQTAPQSAPDDPGAPDRRRTRD